MLRYLQAWTYHTLSVEKLVATSFGRSTKMAPGPGISESFVDFVWERTNIFDDSGRC